MDLQTRAVVGLATVGLAGCYLLPTAVAFARDATARTQVVLLNVCLGWTGGAWVWALVLACGARRAEPVPHTSMRPALPAEPRVYDDGVYLVSAGPDSHTWAIRERNRWHIVYEIAGEERLVGEVDEQDLPISVLAAALHSSAGQR